MNSHQACSGCISVSNVSSSINNTARSCIASCNSLAAPDLSTQRFPIVPGEKLRPMCKASPNLCTQKLSVVHGKEKAICRAFRNISSRRFAVVLPMQRFPVVQGEERGICRIRVGRSLGAFERAKTADSRLELRSIKCAAGTEEGDASGVGDSETEKMGEWFTAEDVINRNGVLVCGSPIVIVESPVMLKTAEPMPMMRRNRGLLKPGDAGRVIDRRPKDVWAVRFAVGAYLIDRKYFEPLRE